MVKVQNRDHTWGDYYFAGRRSNSTRSWVLEMIYLANQNIPSFNELFDQETFYVFAFFVVIGSFFLAFILATIFKVRIREHPLHVDREWRDWKPANPFRFPWSTQCTTRYFLSNYDCVVQAPTGSGKTLAYILPTLQMIMKERNKPNEQKKCDIYALIVVPSRELVTQIADLISPICKVLELKILRLVGGAKINAGKFFKEQSIMIATPGCLEHWSEKLVDLRNYLKSLLVLILDEADRYSDMEFHKSMTSILSLLPKQRRTGLFSATQAKDVEEFMKFGLRNPIRLNVSNDKSTKATEDLGEGNIQDGNDSMEVPNNKVQDVVTPKELACYYAAIDANEKFLALVNLLNSLQNTKFLHGIEMFALHRKLDKNKRLKIFKQFRGSSCSLLLSTDLMARGLDVIDIDWVIQYDIPKYSNTFIHRSGRTARIGKQGKSLVFLMTEELGYLEFVQKHEKIHLQEWKIDGLGEKEARAHNREVQELAIQDRAVLECGTKAFVSFVQAYCKHDCQIVCRLKDLNITGVAHSFGLLRLPQMPELRKCGQNLKECFEGRPEIKTSTILFKNPKEEERRQKKLRQKMEVLQGPMGKQKAQQQIRPGDGDGKSKGKRKKISEWDELKSSANVLKKFKKGKLSKKELEDLL